MIINKFLYKLQMQITNKFLYKLGIDVSKTSQSKECDICHYCYFLGKGFKFQPNA